MYDIEIINKTNKRYGITEIALSDQAIYKHRLNNVTAFNLCFPKFDPNPIHMVVEHNWEDAIQETVGGLQRTHEIAPIHSVANEEEEWIERYAPEDNDYSGFLADATAAYIYRRVINCHQPTDKHHKELAAQLEQNCGAILYRAKHSDLKDAVMMMEEAVGEMFDDVYTGTSAAFKTNKEKRKIFVARYMATAYEY
jgi:hypothetical protein